MIDFDYWTQILSKDLTEEERADCLLMLADELDSDYGAEELRRLAIRPKGLCPEELIQGERYDWNLIGGGYAGDPATVFSSALPATIMVRMNSTSVLQKFSPQAQFQTHRRCYSYIICDTLLEAWMKLLLALDSLSPVET